VAHCRMELMQRPMVEFGGMAEKEEEGAESGCGGSRCEGGWRANGRERKREMREGRHAYELERENLA
jgi:hypothetical protein